MALLRPNLRVLAAVGAAFVLPAWLAAQDSAGEAEVRAAFIYNFTKFIDWPPGQVPADAFRVCVAGAPVLSRAVEAIIRGETAGGRPLVRVELHTPEEAVGCQVLFIGRDVADRTPRFLSAVRDQPVLTIGDGPRFLQQGGAIRFLLEDNRVRFDVNTSAADRARLNISSKLLRVARRVERGAAP